MNRVSFRDHVVPAFGRVVRRARARTSLGLLAAMAGLLAPVASGAQPMDGQQLFKQRCGACHAMDAAQRKPGPHLSGLIGRKAGSVEGARYSDALKAAGLVWDKQTLDAYLAAPRKVVPGTTMTVGVADAAQRAAIVAYLESNGR